MPRTLRCLAPADLPADGPLVVVGNPETLAAADAAGWLPADAQPIWAALLDALDPGDHGDHAETWLPGETPRRLIAIALPTACSRHNCEAQPHAIHLQLAKAAPAKGELSVLLLLAQAAHADAATAAAARAFPSYTRKTQPDEPGAAINLAAMALDGPAVSTERMQVIGDAVRQAGAWVDTPTSELHAQALAAEAVALAEAVGAEVQVISGEALLEAGFGGTYHVGKAAVEPPAIAILSHRPEGATRTVAWVGKGIVYDTGGLSLKPKEGMWGMKADMGGAAGVLAAFGAAVRLGCKDTLHAIICCAENAVGPKSTRPDDIITLYSGKTVEINNTDAEGRLVLGDGVAYAQKDLGAEQIVDMATLTGAQLVSTGKRHAAIVSNDAELEAEAVRAGRASGDLCHPLPFCPEFLKKEFKSHVADMTNSVHDRANAQSSAAAQFVYNHLDGDDVRWLHVDIAGPSKHERRGTGYGVNLLLSLHGI